MFQYNKLRLSLIAFVPKLTSLDTSWKRTDLRQGRDRRNERTGSTRQRGAARVCLLGVSRTYAGSASGLITEKTGFFAILLMILNLDPQHSWFS
jgi:hypothetical protein